MRHGQGPVALPAANSGRKRTSGLHQTDLRSVIHESIIAEMLLTAGQLAVVTSAHMICTAEQKPEVCGTARPFYFRYLTNLPY